MTLRCSILVIQIALAGAVVFTTTIAHADDSLNRSKREADRHFKTGVKLFDEAKYSEALAEFEQAYALKPHPLVLYNLAASHRALSQYDQAVDFFNRFLSEGKGEVDRRRIRRGKKELRQLLELVARITVTTEPEGALVTINGKEVGTTPLEESLIVGPGDHLVGATHNDREDSQRTVRVASGDALEVALILAEKSVDDAATQEAYVTAELESMTARADRGWRVGVNAAFASDTRQFDSTGAPVVGVGVEISNRVAVGLDAVLVAYSVIPNVRVRLFGDVVSVHAAVATPVSFKDGDDTEMFVAGAGGLAFRYQPMQRLSFRLEAWVSYAGAKRGITVPAFVAAELWF